jgi:CelD/BcsL family acetyltransferase involved in cellulose biosynthesis
MTVRQIDASDPVMRAWWTERYHSGALFRNTFFQSPAWIDSWNRHFVTPHPRRSELTLAVESDGRFAAIVPMFVQERKIGAIRAWRSFHLTGEGLAQYPDIITDEAQPAAVWHAVFSYLAAEAPDAWLEIRDVLPESSAAAVEAEAVRQGESYYRLPLDGLNEDTLQHRVSAHLGREIRRARSRFARQTSFDWRMYLQPGERFLHELMALNRTRFGAVSFFADVRNRDFFLDYCTAAATETWCAVLREQGQVISILMGHVHGDSMLYLLSGYDAQRKGVSPGHMNLYRCILFAADMKLRYYDFLRGDEAYKKEYAPEARASRHLLIIPETARRSYRIAEYARRLRRGMEGSKPNA